MNTHNRGYKTILSDEPGPQQPNADHPLFYYEHRNNFLSSLSDKYSSKFRLPTMDLRRNVRVDYYLNRYEQVKQKVERESKKNSCYLNSSQFDTVFSDCIDERRKRNREKLEEQKLKKDLHNLYLAQQAVHQQPEHDNSHEQQHYGNNNKQEHHHTIFVDYPQQEDPILRKELYLLDYQIGKLKLEQRIEKQVEYNRETCRDEQLLARMSNNILSAYMVHFDEIFKLLMDELLVEEVHYLNYMEAQYAVERAEWNGAHVDQQRLQYENAKTIQMMDLVKRLDDLCDQ